MLKLKKNSGIFNQVKFCVSALNLKSDREYPKTLCVKNGVMTGCNGHKLFQWTACNFDDGFFEVIKNNKTEIWLNEKEEIIYPDIDSVFPEEEPEIKINDLVFGDCDNNVISHAIITRALPEDKERGRGLAINYEYLLPLNGKFDCFIYDFGKPIVFEGNEDRKALIMPVLI